MLRSSPASSMQKTYDDCYLICSTAVYFEKQNNEAEALRSWRNALDSIYYHNAYRIPANYKPKTETERALQQSLRDMELQCKERVDLLDALRVSREEAASKEHNLTDGQYYHHLQQRSTSGASNASTTASMAPPSMGPPPIPVVSYPDLAGPTLPQRPNPAQRPSLAPYPSSSSYTSFDDSHRSHSVPPPPVAQERSPPPSIDNSRKKNSRTPSPEKKPGMLRTTLRQGGKDGPRVSSGKLTAATMRARTPAAAGKAATLAWPGSSQPSSRAPSVNEKVPPAEQPRKSNGLYVRAASPSGYLPQPSPRLEQSDHLATNVPSAAVRPKKPRVRDNQAPVNQDIAPKAEAVPPPPPPHRRLDKARPAVDDSAASNGRTKPVAMPEFPSYRQEFRPNTTIDPKKAQDIAAHLHGNVPAGRSRAESPKRRLSPSKKPRPPVPRKAVGSPVGKSSPRTSYHKAEASQSSSSEAEATKFRQNSKEGKEPALESELGEADLDGNTSESTAWDARVKHLMKNLPKGVDEQAAKAIFNEIVIKGDEVHWDDVAGLDIAKNALKEAVVYPFLRPDLFMGLREPARGMLLFGPPGTGKTMLARAVATESKSTFFAISASSLTSKFLGESEKLVRALFSIAKALTPAIIFVDEIDSLLSARAGSGEHEATRRIKTEFLIQWSDLAKAAAGREDKDKTGGDASRVLVLAATNLPWAIDEAARRRFVRRQYIPLPEPHVRESQLRRLLAAQKQTLNDDDIAHLLELTDGFSGSDITALAKDAAMGPLRSLGERLLHMSPEDIRPIGMEDFENSLINIRPSVSSEGLKEFEDWAKQFGERGG